jgi:hypothetical protein
MIFFALTVGGSAWAFPSGDRFDADPLDTMGNVGGGGIFFTGAPGGLGSTSWATATCSTCHTDPPHYASARLGSSPADLFTAGYIPGQSYVIEVLLENETAGVEFNGPPRCGTVKGTGFVPCNANGFALEVDDESGTPVDGLCPTELQNGTCPNPVGDDTILSMDGTSIASTNQGASLVNDPVRWRFNWTAPPAGTGPITFNVGVVDGSGNASPDIINDTINDDVVEAHIAAAEQGNDPYTATTACAISTRRASPFALFPLCAILILSGVFRRRFR